MSDWLAQAIHIPTALTWMLPEAITRPTGPGRRPGTQGVFTTFASSRFVDQETVIERLRTCARRLEAERRDVVAEVADGGGEGVEMRQGMWDAAAVALPERCCERGYA